MPVVERLADQRMYRLNAGQLTNRIEVTRRDDNGEAVVNALRAIEDDRVEGS
jgi:hypothetical protein